MRALFALLLAAAPAAAAFNEGAVAKSLAEIDQTALALQMKIKSEKSAAPSAGRLVLWRGETAETFTSESYSAEPFDRAVMSWNAKGAATFEVEADGRWFTMGKWGDEPRSVKNPEVDVDTLKLSAPARSLRFRVTPEKGSSVSLVAVTLWRKEDHGTLSNERSPAWGKKPLDVPMRAQFNQRTCSPTSLSMVLQYHGTNKPTEEVARGVYDKTADVYGNWPFNTAYAHKVSGLETFVLRMNGWKEVEDEISAGRPVVLSVKGPPLFSSEGHLIVAVGFEKNGDVIVNNPARRDNIRRTYNRAELFKAWLEKGSGIAYVLRRPG